MKPYKKKKTILFIGSFIAPSDGKIGGQYFACSSLIESNLKEDFNFMTLDSTIDSIRVKSVFFRLHKVVRRFLRYNLLILTRKVDGVLLFSSSGMSFIEKGTMALLAKALGRKVIIAPRSGFIVNNVEQSRLFRFFLMATIRSCDVVLCQSEFWKRFFMDIDSKVRPEKFVVIENWLPGKYFQLPVWKKNPSEAALQVLYYNRIEKEKGIFDFLDAMKMLNTERINVEASIFGDGTRLEEVIDLLKSQSLSNTRYKGWMNDSQKGTLQKFDLYVFTSHFEGFPNSLLEVMAYGVPILSTRVGSVNDIVIEGFNGALVDTCSPRQLADAIAKFVGNREMLELYSERSLTRVRQHNSLDKAIGEIKKLFIRTL